MFLVPQKYNYAPELSPGMKAIRKKILNSIEVRGGLYALGARAYADDEVKGSFFIAECFEQCHHISAFQHWGAALVLEIVHYRLEMIRYPLRIIERELTAFT
jgi:hypothetical protein